ncbi:MAG TPA: sigma-70 family RNA polymerase sigma factor [Solirubrobacteraceae bacterium]|nr:sigma-70 family RNA polymerase sigma factor [Solirubrobacteraceae bacterium]
MSPRFSIRLLAAQSDQRLAALTSEGHERAFEALVKRYRRPLLRYACRMRLSEAKAEDVLQQSFMHSWLALSRGVEVRDVRGWLYRIVHNDAVNAMRGPAEGHGELTPAVQDRAALGQVTDIERKSAMHDALGHVAELPDMQRQAIFLTAVDGQSHEEVAGTLGISTGALRGLLYRARTTLRSAAAALTPPPLLELAARSGDAAAPGAERAIELASGGVGAAGIAGLLLKGGAAAVTAGALATGAVLAGHERRATHGQTTGSPVADTARGSSSTALARIQSAQAHPTRFSLISRGGGVVRMSPASRAAHQRRRGHDYRHGPGGGSTGETRNGREEIQKGDVPVAVRLYDRSGHDRSGLGSHSMRESAQAPHEEAIEAVERHGGRSVGDGDHGHPDGFRQSQGRRDTTDSSSRLDEAEVAQPIIETTGARRDDGSESDESGHAGGDWSPTVGSSVEAASQPVAPSSSDGQPSGSGRDGMGETEGRDTTQSTVAY